MDSACRKTTKTRMEVDLLPSKMTNVKAGVYELLNDMLLRYDERLQGVVLAVGEPKILSREAIVHTYFPLCRVQLTVSFLLLSPKPGDALVGSVTQVGPDFIGMLVCGVINASINKADMRSGWEWHAQSQEWRYPKQSGHTIAVNSYVRFEVSSLERTDVFFGIKGSLKTKKTGSVAHLNRKGAATGEDDTKTAKTPATTKDLTKSTKSKTTDHKTANAPAVPASEKKSNSAKKGKAAVRADNAAAARAPNGTAGGSAGADTAQKAPSTSGKKRSREDAAAEAEQPQQQGQGSGGKEKKKAKKERKQGSEGTRAATGNGVHHGAPKAAKGEGKAVKQQEQAAEASKKKEKKKRKAEER